MKVISAAGLCQVTTSAAGIKQAFDWLLSLRYSAEGAMRVCVARTRREVKCSILCCRGGVYEGPVQSGMVGAQCWAGASFP